MPRFFKRQSLPTMLRKKMTLLKLIFLFLTVSLISCVTTNNNAVITHKRTVNFKTGKNISIISVDSSTLVKKNTYSFQTSKEPLVVKIQIDTSLKKISIMSKNTIPKRVYIVDKTHNFNVFKIPPKRIFIMYTDTGLNIFRLPPTKKGTINLTISLPWINYFFNTPTYFGNRNFSGYVGVEGGIEYFYKDSRYFSMFYGTALNFPFPVPTSVKYYGEVQGTNISYFNIRHNVCYKNFDFGCGLNASKQNWQIRNYSKDSTFVDRNTSSIGVGLSLTTQFRFSKFFRIGVIYQPDFIDLTHKTKFAYRHFFSIEFIAKFPIYLFHKNK